MEYVTLGRTGLRVSVAGVGCGGPSRLGLNAGNDPGDSLTVIRRALDLGVNFIDTAEAYRNEAVVGEAVRDYGRGDLVLSTKKGAGGRNGPTSPDDLRQGVERSLRDLGTDTIDVFHLHGVICEQYDHAVEQLVPCLLKLRQQGKIRFLGITERFNADPGHRMLARALQDDCWDVIMVGLNLLNPSARARVLPITMEKNIGVLVMFAVRLALSRPQRLHEVLSDLIAQGLVSADDLDMEDPLGFLACDGVAGSLVEAAYRFCRWEPGTHVILSGTGSREHMEANLRSINSPALPQSALDRLGSLFGDVDCVTAQ
jgi:aryl-alcohol dehydrogenase-like predicted oxidoreductase